MGQPGPLDFGHCQGFRERMPALYLEGRCAYFQVSISSPSRTHPHPTRCSNQPFSRASCWRRPQLRGGRGAQLLLRCLRRLLRRHPRLQLRARFKPSTVNVSSRLNPRTVCNKHEANHDHVGGGQTWTGPTQCPAGSYCKNDGKQVPILLHLPAVPLPVIRVF